MCIQGDLKIEMAKGELQRSPSFLMVFIAFIVYRSPFHVNAILIFLMDSLHHTDSFVLFHH